MLTTYLNTLPFTKFVLIEDSVEEKGKQLLDNLIKTHLKQSHFGVHYFIFQEHFDRIKTQYSTNQNIYFYNYTKDIRSWDRNKKLKDFEDDLENVKDNSIIVIDSLVNLIYMYELCHTYRILNNILLNNSNISQIVSIFHPDLLEESETVVKGFQHLATLSIKLEKTFFPDNGRLSFIYKKVSGKVIKRIEEYSIENENLITKPISKPDPSKLVEESVKVVLPENLSSFKISLTDKDKESRETMTLPYLPKNDEDEDNGEEGKVIYKFDDIDDWDEEDPDDDLDI